MRLFARYVWERFDEDRLMVVAASLSYTSLLALVPLLAISFAALSAFPVFEGVRESVQAYIVLNFLPETGSTINSYLETFLANTGSLTAVGIVGLAVTAVLLLNTIDAAFNTVFRTKRQRPLAARLLVSWTFLTMAPLLLGASLSLSTVFFTVTAIVGVEKTGTLMTLLAGVLPNLLVVLALGLFYFLIPNKSVQFRHALVGAVVAGTLFALLRKGFGLYMSGSTTYQTVYGAAATVPVFLLWMYLTWAVILLGAELTASLDAFRQGKGGGATLDKPGNRAARLQMALELLSELRRQSRDSGGAIKTRDLARACRHSRTLVEEVLECLRPHGTVAMTEEDQWVLARDLETLPLGDLCTQLEINRPRLRFEDAAYENDDTPPWHGALMDSIQRSEEAQATVLAVSVAEILGKQAGGVDQVSLAHSA
ncbi:MAG: YihY family inner membrane protein [Magnetospiraceae bacterium]